MNLQKMFGLSGRTALVTGSSQGIGRAIALGLAEAGAKVIVHASCHGEQMEGVVAEIKASGGEAYSCAADLGVVKEVERMAEECLAFTGRLDILIMNASTQSYQMLEDFTPEELQRQYAVNLQSSFMLIEKFLPGMKARGWGRLLSIGSVNEWKPSPRLGIYASSKCAQTSLIMNCASQYSEFGITANNLAPGVIKTGRNAEALKDQDFCGKLLEKIPARRFGEPSDCAGPALLLCSEAGAYITGATIPVTGGMHM